jgi:ubiquinone biosynthesis protein Coq4
MKTIKKLRSKLLELLTHDIALPLITKFRNNAPFDYSMDELEKFPEGTLGKDLVVYLKKMNFKLLRNYERHDCKHIILGYEMDELGEACMQFYFFGNRHYSIPVLSTVIMCFVLMPEHWLKFYAEFKKGRKGKTFDDLDYNQLVWQQTASLAKIYRYENR